MAFSNHDIVPDSPTNNFATWNPLDAVNSAGSLLGEFSEGNLKRYIAASAGNAPRMHSFATIYPPNSGKWYLEFSGIDNRTAGLIYESVNKSGFPATNYIVVGNNIADYNDGTITSGGSTAVASTDILGLLYDVDAATISFYKNGTQFIVFGSVTTTLKYAFASLHNASASNGGIIANFGQDPTFGGASNLPTGAGDYDTDAAGNSTGGRFAFQPPTGALALCTANLPKMTPTVDDDVPQDYFKAVTYAGQTVGGAMTAWDGTTGTVNVGFQPDFVWTKPRNDASSHNLIDSVRGALKIVRTDGTGQEGTYPGSITSFNTNGYSLGTGADFNNLNVTYVAWCWKAGGPPDLTSSPTKPFAKNGVQHETLSAANITAGTITPTAMSVNTDAGFSIVKYGGSNTTGLLSSSVSSATIPHGLNDCEFCIIKNIKWTNTWVVSHRSIAPNVMSLQDTGQAASTPPVDPAYGQITTLGSNTVTITRGSTRGDNVGEDFDAGGGQFEYIMYCWHSVEGYSKFGSYTGNGLADGSFVYCGFRPAFVMIKNIDVSSAWSIFDSARDESNVVGRWLTAHSSTEEQNLRSSYYPLDFLSNGFKLRTDVLTGITNINLSNTYIFMAFAEQPFIYSNAR